MQNLATEKLLSKILAYGSALTTVFLISGGVTDPVNAPKLLVIGVMAMSAVGLVLSSNLRARVGSHRMALLPTVIFLVAMAVSVISSKSPLSQNLYGSYGRNNGLITYLFLALILFSALVLRQVDGFTLLVKALFFAGLVNVAYCLWVISFGDFIGWSNPYGNILGTLGNPDFIGGHSSIRYRNSRLLLLKIKIQFTLCCWIFSLFSNCRSAGSRWSSTNWPIH